MNNEKLNDIFEDPNTNWKYVAVVAFVGLVALSGILTYKNFFPVEQGISLPVQEILETSEQPEVPSDWKIYKSEKYGLEAKYPKDWSIVYTTGDYHWDFQPTCIIKEEKGPKCENYSEILANQIDICISKTLKWDKKILEQNGIINDQHNNSFRYEKIKLDRIIATKFYNTNHPWYPPEMGMGNMLLTQIIFNHNDSGCTISYHNIDEEGNHNMVIDQILSTFKFIE